MRSRLWRYMERSAAASATCGSSPASSRCVPKATLTGMAWQGYYLDPEGNTFGFHQPDPEAK